MLLKEYTKYGKYGKYNFVLALKKAEFNFFLNKFFGSLISRGKKNLAINMFNKILINFKNKFKSDPFIELHKAINNLIPILSSTQKKMGKIYHAVPSLAVGTRRFVIMISWVIKKQKNKTNVRGLKIEEVSKQLIDAVYKKGVLLKLKRQFLATSLSGKHLLYMNRRRSFVSLRRYKRASFKLFSFKANNYRKKKKYLLNYDDIVSRRR